MAGATRLSRRQFHAATISTFWGAAHAGAVFSLAAEPQGEHASQALSIEHQGVLIRECTLPGETRQDDVVPRHANGLQVSRDRWLVLYMTHGFRGVDDERSIIYQLRRAAPDGPVMKEGFLARAQADWDPLGEGGRSAGQGKCYFKQHGHMVAFGVPKGALIGGRSVPHANLFVAKWRVLARVLDKKQNLLEHKVQDAEATQRTQNVEWVQFRLSDREDDIEILQPVSHLRQQGYEQGARFCRHAEVQYMNQTFVPAVPLDAACTQWADCNHFDQRWVAALKYRFHPRRGLYEWVETGPLLSAPKKSLMEASLARAGDQWVIAARLRGGQGVAWLRTPDPFAPLPAPLFPAEPPTNSPLTVFRCGDGVLRLFTGDPKASPHRNGRDPLYCWEVQPEQGFACLGRRVIYDSVQAGLPLRREVSPKVDFCQLFPPHGRTQLVVHSVCTRAYNHPYENRPGIPPLTASEKAPCAVYYARITYQHDCPAPWEFPPS
jgi:hypothetical protein